jgi:PKD repeat protein
MKQTSRYERIWATGLIVVGVALLGVVFVSAFAIVGDPGGYYDEWVPADGAEGPEASFDWVSSGLAVEFVDASSIGDADIERWVWEFGDGADSADPSPSHRFAEEGEFTVTLDVVDENRLSSQAQGTVEVSADAANSGQGAIGLGDLADRVTSTVERSAKGGAVVVLVIAMFVILTMIGGRLLRHGVRTLRPIPERISVKLRPKELELVMADPRAETPTTMQAATPAVSADEPAVEETDERVGTSV